MGRRNSQLAEERRLREEQDREFEESLLADQLASVRRESEVAVVVPSTGTAVPPVVPAPHVPATQATVVGVATAAAGADVAASAALPQAEDMHGHESMEAAEERRKTRGA